CCSGKSSVPIRPASSCDQHDRRTGGNHPRFAAPFSLFSRSGSPRISKRSFWKLRFLLFRLHCKKLFELFFFVSLCRAGTEVGSSPGSYLRRGTRYRTLSSLQRE